MASTSVPRPEPGVQMFRHRVWIVASSFAIAVSFVVLGHGQDLPAGRLVMPMNLPGAVDQGVAPETTGIPPNTMGTRSVRSVARDLRFADRSGTSGVAYQPGRVIVKFRDPLSVTARRLATSTISRSAAMRARQPYADFDVIDLDPSEDPENAAREFAARGDVEYAQAAYRVHAYSRPTDPEYGKQWNMPAIDMERAWDIQPGSNSSIIVAVVDTGMAYLSTIIRFNAQSFRLLFSNGTSITYPALGPIDVPFAGANDLAGGSRPCPSVSTCTGFVKPWDFIWEDATPVDLVGHGTHVSGTIGQLTNNGVGVAGIAYNVRLMPVKVI